MYRENSTNKLMESKALEAPMPEAGNLPGLPHLGLHLRNLAYAVPVARLTLERNTLAPGEHGLFDRIDLTYAAMALIVFLMERRTTDLGAERKDIIEYMGLVIGAMRSDHPIEMRRRAAEIVLEALTNRTDQHQAFRADYFEPGVGLVPHEFRLINIATSDDGRILYTATNEAIILHLAMLNVDPAVAQNAEEMMLKYLVECGRFKESVHLAERARARSIQYQQFIRTKIFESRRAPELVRWTRDVVPELRAAASHVGDCQKHESAILDAIFANREHAGSDSLGALNELQRLIEDCQARHSSLHKEVMTAADEFLDLQAEAFRPRQSLTWHDLEQDTLGLLLGLPIRSIAAAADEFAALLSPPRIEKVLSLAGLFDELVAPELDDAEIRKEDEDNWEDIHELPDLFPAALQTEVETYVRGLLDKHSNIDIEGVLHHAERDGLDRRRRRCAAFLMLQAFHPDENPFGGKVTVAANSPRFTSNVAAGSRLLFEHEDRR